MKVSIVIPNWNGKEKLQRNLPKVLKVRGADEVIVVDDASTDDSVEFIKANFPDVKLITKQKNTGFGSNVNLGVKNATGDLIFLLNSDAVPEVDCLEKVLPHFKNEQVFSVGFNTGGNWSWAKWEGGFFWHFMAKADEKPETHETLWASGGSSVFRKSVWDQLNGFNPLYDPFYVEDVDLGYRAWKRGYKNLWEKDAHVEHYKQKGVIAENFSRKKVTNTAERNMLIFTWINIHDQSMFNEHIFRLAKRLIVMPKYWLILLRALIKLPEILEKRKTEIKEAKIGDKELLAKYTLN